MVQWLGRLLYTQKATGSIPVTEILHRFQLFFAVVQNTQLANFNSARGFVFATMSQVASLAELRRLGGVSSVIRLLDKSFVGDEEDGNKTSAATPAAAPAPAPATATATPAPAEAVPGDTTVLETAVLALANASQVDDGVCMDILGLPRNDLRRFMSHMACTYSRAVNDKLAPLSPPLLAACHAKHQQQTRLSSVLWHEQ